MPAPATAHVPVASPQRRKPRARTLRSRLAAELGHLLDAIPDGVVIADAAGQIQLANRQTEALFGYDQQVLVGQPVEALMPTRFHTVHPTHRAKYAVRPRVRPMGAGLQLYGRHQDGTEFPVEISLSPITVADVPLVLATIRDVTAQRLLEQQARDELAGRLAVLQTVLDELPVGVYLARGQDAELVLANHQLAGIWGAEWLAGQPMTSFLATSGARAYDLQGGALAFEQLATVRALRSGHSVRQHQEVIRRGDGSVVHVLVNAIALAPQVFPYLSGLSTQPAAAAPVPLVLVVHQDVGALKEAERLKDEFVALAAHELRNPVASLLGYAQMLADAASSRHHQRHIEAPAGPGDSSDSSDRSAADRDAALAAAPPATATAAIPPEWQEEAASVVIEASRRLAALIDDLLDATRLQANRLSLRPEPLELGALLHRVVKRTQASTTAHAIALSVPDEPVVVEADVQRLEQVVINLLSNAIKYSPGGGPIAVTLTVHETLAPAEGEGAGTWAQVTVRDQGMGIPADQFDRLFTRFGRAENARERAIPGTGLGLFLCRELVERQGGRIWFESTEGAGTTFTFELPRWTESESTTPG